MIVLHAIWDSVGSKRLHIWAESSGMTAGAQDKSQRSKRPRPLVHPFALSRDQLRQDVSELFSSEKIPDFSVDIFAILLPYTKSGPQPSPGLLREEERSYEKLRALKPWFVDTLSFRPDAALDFLISLPARPQIGKAYSTTLQFWIEAAKFSLELISRQRFVPTFAQLEEYDTGEYHAEWNVVITEEDYQKLRILSKAMPPCCRAFYLIGGEELPGNTEIITDFLNAVVDSFVRNSLRRNDVSLLPKTKSKRKNPSLPELWLKAWRTYQSRREFPKICSCNSSLIGSNPA